MAIETVERRTSACRHCGHPISAASPQALIAAVADHRLAFLQDNLPVCRPKPEAPV